MSIYDKNKHELMKEMHKYAEMPLNDARARYIAMCYDAYKAMCMICEEGEEEDKRSEYSGNYDVEVTKDSMSVTRTHKDKHRKLTKSEAEHWVKHMINEDGTTGEHFTIDQIRKVMPKIEADCEDYELWAGTNALYSDMCDSLKKYGVNTVDFYAELAYEYWFEDEDAVDDKLSAYYHNIVKH